HAPFLHWIRRIATRVGYRYWRQKARRQDLQDAVESHYRTGLVSPEDQTPSEAAESLFHLLEQLDPKDRLVLTLFYFEQCDTREIAERVGWSHTLVRVRMHRARQRLRTLLEQAGLGREERE
ncbi:MAG: sigma-70 family RNA polymerase sigma factor, partial [Candidatus Hydrogenedentes bacterium]|nr:sigma-70 family RNA polymerase sigma factor [Candidatus Hydrogenedentota bacterium]